MGVASLILLGKIIFYIFLLIYVYVTLKERMTEGRRDTSMEEGKERKWANICIFLNNTYTESH